MTAPVALAALAARGGDGGTLGGVLVVGGAVFFVGFFIWFIVRARRRRALVHTAATEASLDEPHLAPERVEQEAAELFTAVQHAWDAGDRARLGELLGQDLMAEWSRRLDENDRQGLQSRFDRVGTARAELVGLVNRQGADQDRVTVHVMCSTRPYLLAADGKKITPADVGKLGMKMVNEYWTLARHGDRWVCVTIEGSQEGEHRMKADVVATPEADTGRIRDEAVVELAGEDAPDASFTTADLAAMDFDGSARQAALDLALADGRFAPEVLEVAARRVVAAWAEAVDGSDAELAAVAAPEAVRRLLHGDDASQDTRLVVRGPQVRRINVAAVDAKATPPQVHLEVEVKATRFAEDRGTGEVVSGSKALRKAFTEHWTLTLDGPPESPWRLTATA